MDPTYAFRRALLHRLLDMVSVGVRVGVGVGALANPAMVAGCGAKVVVDLDPDGGVGGAGGAQSTTGTVGMTGSGMTGGCALTSTGTGNGASQVTECFAPPAGGCPDEYHADMYIIPSMPCVALKSVDCGPVQSNGNCCYLVTETTLPPPCGMGRPFVVDGDGRAAAGELRDGGWSDHEIAPRVDELDRAARRALAAAWTVDALLEHASIASFARFSLELLAVGAPAELVAEAHRAALDETRHARLCFALAGAYRGAPVAPSPFPFGEGVAVASDLAAVAAATARDGCIGETLSAMIAAEQLAQATDPAVRRVLEGIAADEARHAELAWRFVTWALEQGDDAARLAVVEVFGNAARHLPSAAGALEGIATEVAAAHGRLSPDGARKAMVRALAEVVLPCAEALIASTAGRAPEGDATAAEAEPLTQRSPC